MTDQHPITPPPELVEEWFMDQRGLSEASRQHIATAAARWGADQELEACCEWMRERGLHPEYWRDLRAARRPKPPSLKEQALRELGDVYNDEKIDDHVYDTIRRALEQLND
jgi:hypothetical protein